MGKLFILNRHAVSSDMVLNGADVPQHRLLTKKEWAWIRKGHNWGYWTVTGTARNQMHHELVHVDVETETVRAE